MNTTTLFKQPRIPGILLILLLTCSCQFNSQYLNREEDKKDAEKVTTKFFQLIKEKKYDETLKFFSPQFFKVTPINKLKNIYTITNLKLGHLKFFEVDKWETRRVEGTNPVGEYNFLYKTRYEKFNAVESIRLIRETNGTIKILAYNVNSDGFMQ